MTYANKKRPQADLSKARLAMVEKAVVRMAAKPSTPQASSSAPKLDAISAYFGDLLQSVDPDLRLDGISSTQILGEGKRLVEFAIAELKASIERTERADSAVDGDALALVPLSILRANGVEPTFPLYDSNPRLDTATATKRVLRWNGLKIGVTHEANQDYRFGKRLSVGYGRLYGSYGHAGDKRSHDFLIGPDLDQDKIFAIQQLTQDGARDEVKYGIGFESPQSFKLAYQEQLPSTLKDVMFGGVWETDPEEFDQYRESRQDSAPPSNLDEVYKKYRAAVNMSASELKAWAKTPASKAASVDRTPVQRNIELLETPKDSWTQKHVDWANRTISFVARMKNSGGKGKGTPINQEIPFSKKEISLRNWAYRMDDDPVPAIPTGDRVDGQPGLVKKKVKVEGANGKTYESTRWTKPPQVEVKAVRAKLSPMDQEKIQQFIQRNQPSHQPFIQAGGAAIPDDIQQRLSAIGGGKTLLEERDWQAQIVSGLLEQLSEARRVGDAQTEADIRQKGSAEFARLKEQEDRVQSVVEAMGDLRSHLLNQSPITKELGDLMANLVEVDESTAMPPAEIRGHLSDIYRLTGGKGSTLKRVVNIGDRPFANLDLKTVNIGKSKNASDLYHEVAHFAEWENARFAKASHDWLRSRATGKPQKLKDLTGGSFYRDDEIAVPDKFVNPYVGKLYLQKNNDKVELGLSTEVLSTGFERMATPDSMARFYLSDPEHFKLTLGAITHG